MTTKSKNFTILEQKQLVEFYQKRVKRMNFNGGYYLTIFCDAAKQYKIHQEEAEDLFETSKKNGATALEWYLKDKEIELKMKHNELIAITFAVMFLECIIWDYAAVNTSQNLTEDYLSKLSLLGKWKVIPKLVNNDKKIDIGGKAITLLKKLQSERHNIIHSKSKAVPDTYDKIKEQERKGRKITIPETVKCVKGCMEGLRKVDTTNYWQFEEEEGVIYYAGKFPTFRTIKSNRAE